MVHQQTVTFDRVFDVVKNGRGKNNEPSTSFGFEHDGHAEYGVSVPGHPDITAGITVTAILKEPGNWQTLVGWVNHRTGEVVCINRIGPILSTGASVIFATVASIASEINFGLKAVILFGSAVLFTASIKEVYNVSKVHKTLMGLGKTLKLTNGGKVL